MLISWEWLSDYVKIDRPLDEVVSRWAMSGLNHEGTEIFEGVPVIDLEVTSNRADCLGHIGIAREASVLYRVPLVVPQPNPAMAKTSIASVLQLDNRFLDACPRYTARVIRGVKIGPSPEWLAKRLRAIGIKTINNVVDATNYVMMECGQPLHAFDLPHIRGGKIIVRPAAEKENFLAIDHKNYVLDSQMVVIADAERAVALGGVMGGAESEVSDATTDLLIESASFVPMAIRRTARKLKLHSPSSHRYERRIDPNQLDWASRRCCELILATAGGELLDGVLDTNPALTQLPAVELRKSQIVRVLGIEIPWETSCDILKRLGCEIGHVDEQRCTVAPPSFRQDLPREIDLIEEVARIHGYEQIPEDAMVPMVASMRRPKDIVMSTLRNVATAAGFDETLNPSLIGRGPADRISPWSNETPLATMVPLLEGASTLRRSLIPSLIAARLHNQSQSNRDVRLFETANVYLPSGNQLPREQLNLGCIAESELRIVRGVFEEILQRVWGVGSDTPKLTENKVNWDFLESGSGIAWQAGETMLCWIGSLSRSSSQSLKLDGPATLGEMNLDLLLQHAQLVPRVREVIPFPAIERDLNLVVEEVLQWQSLRGVIAESAGPLCVDILFREIYRDTKRDGAGKKRMLLTLKLQSATDTLRSEQADEVVASVLGACRSQLGAELLA
ncbi:MAG: phenylalanine--tRNA ligase subunit beta [Planctomycetes bacterium]|nr:phenylalanine--tRNA ligase subunit beta [Planctomycetota bacterium]